MACLCSSRARLEHCKPLTPCVTRRSCEVSLGGHDRRQHGDRFLVDGSPCVCHDGQLLCASRSCLPDARSPLYTGSLLFDTTL